MATTSVSGASFSADEKRILFSSNETGIFNVYSVPVAGGPATPRHAAPPRTPRSRSRTSRNDDRVLFTRDQGGNELNHLYVRERGRAGEGPDAGREAEGQLPGLDARRATRSTCMTNERDARFFDLYRYDAKTYARTLVYKDETGYQLRRDLRTTGAGSPSRKPNSTSDSDIYLWDAATKEMKHLSPHEGDGGVLRRRTSTPRRRRLYYLTNDGGEFTRVRRYDLATGQARGGGEGGLGRLVHLLLPPRPVPRHRHQRGRRAR